MYLLAIVSLVILGYGYYKSLDIRTGNIFSVVPVIIIIIIGTYGLFKSVLPVIINLVMKNKNILFNGDNIIAINNINYRLNKSYKTYAIISIIITTTISTLGAAVAFKSVQENAQAQRNIYTVSIASSDKNEINKEHIDNIIKETNKIKYEVNPKLLVLDNPNSRYIDDKQHVIMKYSDFENTLKVNGNKKELQKYNKDLVKGNNVITLMTPQTIMSFATKESKVNINGQDYNITKGEIKTPVLGTGINSEIIVVNEDVYSKLEDKGSNIYFYGAKVESENKSDKMFENLQAKLNLQNGYIMNGYKAQTESQWIKFAYAVLVFLFIVFAIVAGSIIYMKIYNDAYEDKEKYKTLIKIGTTYNEINRAILKEVSMFYILPMISAGISSYFALRLAGDLMMSNLFSIYILSMIICFIIFVIYGILSVSKFKKIIYEK